VIRRNYINHTIDQLEALVDGGDLGVDLLNQIIAELSRRSPGGRTRQLHKRAIRLRDIKLADTQVHGVATVGGNGALPFGDQTPASPKQPSRPQARDTQPHRTAAELAAEADRLGKLYDRLREKLLDMTLSNPMLSYKHQPTSKRQLRIVDEVPEEVYRALVGDSAALDILPLPEPEGTPEDERSDEFRSELERAMASDLDYLVEVTALEREGRDDGFALADAETRLRTRLRTALGMPARPNRKTVSPADHARSLGLDPNPELQAKAVKDGHRDRQLQTLKWPDSLAAILDKVQSDAVLAEQEMGLSTLFLVFGFLEWTDAKGSQKRLHAPLLMLPVKLVKRDTARGRKVFTLAASSEQTDANLSLAKKLETLGLQLPAFEPVDGAPTPVEDYFNAVNEVVSDQAGWEVRRWLTLGHFAFGRFAMYADLDPGRWPQPPAENNLVGAVLRGTEIGGDGGAGLSAPPPDYDIDSGTVETIAPYLVRDADASQHSAIIDVMDGKNLVIQGPPGTGKSQTIANVIANALAANRKVLFLAEKMAALDVVKRRLDEDGLGHFCLELHSDKASARQVVQSLAERHKLGYGTKAARSSSDGIWLEARREIRRYLEALHVETDVGKPFGQFWKAIRMRAELGDMATPFRKTALPADVLTSNERFEATRDRLAQYASMRQDFEASFGPANHSPWAGLIEADDVNIGIAYPLLDELTELGQRADALVSALALAAPYGMAMVQALRDSPDLAALPDLSSANEQLVAFLASQDRSTVAAVLAALDELDRATAALAIPAGLDPENEGQRSAILRVCLLLDDADLDETPRETLERITVVLDQAEAVRAAASAAAPHVQALGLPGGFPVAGTRVLWVASRMLSHIPHELRRIVLCLPAGTAATLEPIAAEWAGLTQQEAAWRTRFTGASERWPSADALLAAAEIRGKKGIGGMMSSFGASARTVADVHAALGVPSTVKLTVADYRDLARHAQRLAAFNANMRYRALFLEVWRGLDTPIATLHEAVKRWEQIRDLMAGAPGGRDVLRQLDVLGPDVVPLLASAQSGLSAWGDLAEDIRKLAGSASFETLDQHLAISVRSARRLAESGDLACLVMIDTSWLELKAVIERIASLRQARERLMSMPGALRSMLTDHRGQVHAVLSWCESVREAGAAEVAGGALLAVGACAFLDGYRRTQAKAREALEAAERQARQMHEAFGVRLLSVDLPGPLADTVSALLGRRAELQQWLALHKARANCLADGLKPFLEVCDAHEIAPGQLPELFAGLVAVQRAHNLRRHDPVLSKATGTELASLREQFRLRDRQRKDADRKAVFAAVIGGQPLPGSNFGPKKTWTERELLHHQFGNQNISIRVLRLLRQAGKSIQAMKPCFMMSPLSLAKFVPAGTLEFDLLVIDEASQMRPEDALGGLLRARQVVVVGDPKQLPPTNFFQRSGDDTAVDADGVPLDDDDESILDACHKSFRQLRLLRWHYRSRCESLIAFSNRHIYAPEGRQLITFPAAAPGSFSIDRIRVQGTYDQQRNPAEALRIAEDCLLFMQHHAGMPEPPTLGVVAMNSKQAEFILDQITMLARGDELAETYQAKVAARGERFFVKNLENVQGDERDYILISLTYGPKPGQTKVLQLFGPITGKQGHRRLNVLFTRARVRIGLYTSMDASQVKPAENSSRGVHLLQQYLAYVEGGGREAAINTGRDPDSDFEIDVAERLRANGFDIVYQVGVSGFRIDLGVVHPDMPGQYLAGVECDGARYHASKSARDRDRLRQDVLESLGWSILRVWSTDWFDDPDRQTRVLVASLGELRKNRRTSGDVFRFVSRDDHLPAQPAAGRPVPPDASTNANGETDRTDGPADTLASSPAAVHPPPVSVAPQTGSAKNQTAGGTMPSTLLRERLTPGEARMALAAFRDQVIAPAISPWEPERSILRAAMIETFVEQRISDEQDWFGKVPQFQRRGTNPAEKARYLADICDIIAKIR
jgi:very-short-patch-repair endonuclease